MSDAIREAFEALIKYRKAYDEMYQMLGMFLDAEEGLEKPDIDQAWSAFNQAPGPVYWEKIEAALQQTAPAVPDGWKLVPIEPTLEMREAFHDANEEWEDGGLDSPDHQYQAMLAAAPKPDHSPDAGKVVQEGPIDIEMGTGDVLIGDLKGDGFSGVIFYRDSQEFEVGQPHPEMSGIPCNEVNGRIFSVTTSNPESLKVLYRAVGRALDHLGHPPAPAADGGEVEPLGYLTNQAVARLQSDKRLNGEHLYAFKPDDMSKFQAVYLGPAVKESLTAAHPDQPHKDVQAQSLFDFANEIVAGHHPGMNEKHVPGVRAAAQFVANAKRLRSNGGDA